MKRELLAKLNGFMKKYMHPLWRDVSEMAKRVGGHGGMDFNKGTLCQSCADSTGL